MCEASCGRGGKSDSLGQLPFLGTWNKGELKGRKGTAKLGKPASPPYIRQWQHVMLQWHPRCCPLLWTFSWLPKAYSIPTPSLKSSWQPHCGLPHSFHPGFQNHRAGISGHVCFALNKALQIFPLISLGFLPPFPHPMLIPASRKQLAR